jgi:hypothetical protein
MYSLEKESETPPSGTVLFRLLRLQKRNDVVLESKQAFLLSFHWSASLHHVTRDRYLYARCRARKKGAALSFSLLTVSATHPDPRSITVSDPFSSTPQPQLSHRHQTTVVGEKGTKSISISSRLSLFACSDKLHL